MRYRNRLERLTNPPPLLADFPEFVEQFPERRDDIGLVPSKRGFIPELFPR